MKAHLLNTTAAVVAPTAGTEVIEEDGCVFLTIWNKPASSSRDEDVKLEGRSRMRPRLQLGHPT